MDFQVLLQHGSFIYDATAILTDGVEWFASVMGKAGRLKFKVVRDGIVNFTEGDKVTFLVDGKTVFVGWVMTKERTDEQIISVTAYDQLFYLVRNKGTYIFQNQTAADVIRTIAADYGLQTGQISDSGWRIPQRIEEGEVLIDMILSALELCGKAAGQRYFLFDEAGKLTAISTKRLSADVMWELYEVPLKQETERRKVFVLTDAWRPYRATVEN